MRFHRVALSGVFVFEVDGEPELFLPTWGFEGEYDVECPPMTWLWCEDAA
jgi:hypothetical protein